ncbi:hypothetical protein Tco_1417641 [Tanacetum coccineum]
MLASSLTGTSQSRQHRLSLECSGRSHGLMRRTLVTACVLNDVRQVLGSWECVPKRFIDDLLASRTRLVAFWFCRNTTITPRTQPLLITLQYSLASLTSSSDDTYHHGMYSSREGFWSIKATSMIGI